MAACRRRSHPIVALAAIHASRPQAFRLLTLNDIDLPNRRIILNGLARPLDELTHDALRDYLAERRRCWPHTTRTSCSPGSPLPESSPSAPTTSSNTCLSGTRSGLTIYAPTAFWRSRSTGARTRLARRTMSQTKGSLAETYCCRSSRNWFAHRRFACANSAAAAGWARK